MSGALGNMTKESLLRLIAQNGYNVGFGAKKHFATYDIVEKAPGWIGLASMAVGILSLFYKPLSGEWISAAFIILGVGALYITIYNEKREQYAVAGTKLTKHFNALRDLYYTVQSSNKADLSGEQGAMNAVMAAFYTDSITKQIFLSDWYAHYKFFWQFQIDWIDEQKHFRFWRDKVPLSMTVTAAVVGAAIAILWLVKLCK